MLLFMMIKPFSDRTEIWQICTLFFLAKILRLKLPGRYTRNKYTTENCGKEEIKWLLVS